MCLRQRASTLCSLARCNWVFAPQTLVKLQYLYLLGFFQNTITKSEVYCKGFILAKEERFNFRLRKKRANVQLISFIRKRVNYLIFFCIWLESAWVNKRPKNRNRLYQLPRRKKSSYPPKIRPKRPKRPSSPKDRRIRATNFMPVPSYKLENGWGNQGKRPSCSKKSP